MAEEKPDRIATALAHVGSEGAPLRARTVAPPLQRGSTLILPDASSLYATDRPTMG